MSYKSTMMSIAVWVSAEAGAVTSSAKAPQNLRPNLFPIAPEVHERAAFWEKVFSRYPASSVLIHDEDFPSLVIDVIDFDLLAKKKI